MKKFIHIFIPAILAGVCIALGGTVFLSSDTKLAGALFFCLGLLTILTCGFGLFTGKVCYTLDNKATFLGTLGIIWLGNLTGTGLSALFARFTRNYQSLNEKAAATISAKLSDSLVSLFVLGIGCGICIYIAINSYKTQDGFLKVTFVILPVMVFIFCGFEHCVADNVLLHPRRRNHTRRAPADNRHLPRKLCRRNADSRRRETLQKEKLKHY